MYTYTYNIYRYTLLVFTQGKGTGYGYSVDSALGGREMGVGDVRSPMRYAGVTPSTTAPLFQ